MSELLREAIRYYERQRWWEEVNAYGRERAQALGIHENDVERLVHEARQEKRGKRSSK